MPSTVTEPRGAVACRARSHRARRRCRRRSPSRMSSSVTSPITLAILVDDEGEMHLAARNSRSCTSSGVVSEHVPGRQQQAENVDVVGVGRRLRRVRAARRGRAARQECSPAARDRPARGCAATTGSAARFPRTQAGVDRHHLGAVDHHVGDFEFAEREQAAEHVAVFFHHRAAAVQEIDGAAPIPRCRRRPRGRSGAAERPQHDAPDRIEHIGDRHQRHHQHRRCRRDQRGEAVGGRVSAPRVTGRAPGRTLRGRRRRRRGTPFLPQ